MRSIFGWSYPPGCSGPPEDYEAPVVRCKCGAFAGGKANFLRLEPWESATQCDGSPDSCYEQAGKHEPHKIVWDNGAYQVFQCTKCGEEVRVG